MIFGAFAYRSAKQRSLGLKPDTRWTLTMEFLLLFAILCTVSVLAFKGLEVWADNPISGIVVPIWSLIAYCLVRGCKKVCVNAVLRQ